MNQATAPPGSKVDSVLLYALIALQLALIWSVSILPSQDGPAHVANANVLLRLIEQGDKLFWRFYQINPQPENWIDHLLLAALLIVMSPVTAVKVLASGYVVLLPLAARFAVRSLGAVRDTSALLILPFSMCLIFHKGFYGFCYSLVGFFFLVGMCLRWQNQWSLSKVIAVIAVSVLLDLLHPLSLAIACVVIAILTSWNTILTWKRSGLSRNTFFSTAAPVLSLIPAFTLLLRFVLRSNGNSSKPFPLMQLLLFLLRLDVLPSFRTSEHVIATGVVLLFAGLSSLAVMRRRQPDYKMASTPRFDCLLPALLAALLIYFTTPNVSAGGSWITYRLMLYPFFLLTVWLAAQPLGSPGFNAIRIGVPALVISMLLLQAGRYRQISAYLQDFRSAASVMQPHHTLLPIVLSPRGSTDAGQELSHNVRAFTQASGYLAAENDLVDLSNYEANLDYFPVQFRSGMSPAVAFADLFGGGASGDGRIVSEAMELDLDRFTDDTGEPIDYVLIWQTHDRTSDRTINQRLTKVMPYLMAEYDKVFVSPMGFATVYARKSK